MKKVILSYLSVFFLIGSLMIPGEYAKAAPTEEIANIDIIQDMAYALENTKLKLNIDNPDSNIVQKTVYDKNGEFLGVLGMEIVTENENIITNRMTLPFDKKSIDGTTKVKVYWYTAAVNYHFYADVAKDSSGKAYIERAYDQYHFVIPPATVSSDQLEIIQKTETSSVPAEARYTLTLSSYIGGSAKLWIFVKAADGYFWTGGN